MNAARIVADVELTMVWIELWTFAIMYHVLSCGTETPWWRDVGGRLTMALAASEGTVVGVSVLRMVAGLDAPWFAWAGLVAFAALPLVDGACVYALWRIYHPRQGDTHGRHSAPEDRGD